MIQKTDEERCALRQTLVDPLRALAFAFQYVVGDVLIVSFRLQFGWKASLGWFGLVSSVILHEDRRTTYKSVKLTPAGIRTTKHVQIPTPSGKRIVPVPA